MADPEGEGGGGGGCGPRAHSRDPPMFTLDYGFNISGHAIIQNRSNVGFTHLRVQRKTNLVPKCSNFVTKAEKSSLVKAWT